jgi:polyisoprenoid-binding protein YceI
MRKLVATLTTTLIAISPAYAAESYQLDGSHTAVIFGVSHMGLSYTYGRFNEVKGSYELDRENLADSKFTMLINAGSIDTNSQGRDQHLKGPDFFNASQFPAISFESTKVVPKSVEGKTVLTITGNLTMHGVTKPITFDLLMVGEGQGPRGDFRTGFHTDTKIMRSQFGMTNMIPNIGDEIAVTISFEGLRQQTGAKSVNPTTRRVGATAVSARSTSRAKATSQPNGQ